jgi:hypothetical protein
MKRKSLLFLLLFALLAPWAANAQTVTIGDGTDGQYGIPIDQYYNYSFTEMLYTASDIAAGNPTENNITRIAFDSQNGANGYTYGITVYMKNVDDSELSSFIAVSTADAVFTGTVSPTTGWVSIDLDDAFTYDNTKNLLIAVNKTSGGYAGSSYLWNYTTTTANTVLLAHTDGSVYNPTSTLPTASSYGYTKTNRPNVQITFSAPATCIRPTLGEAEYITTEGASFQWTENGSATQWVLEYSTDANFTNPTQINRNGIPAYAITGLDANTTYYVHVKSVCGAGDESSWSNSVSFTTLNPCAAPTNFVASNITASSATLSWTAGYQETAWTVKYKKSSESSWDNATTVSVSGTPTTSLTGLDGLTVYNVRVFNCTGDNDPYLSGNFTTAASFPYSQNFSASGIPTGWSQYSGLLADVLTGTALTSTSYGWNNGTGNGVLDGNHLYANIYSTGCKKWIVTPAIPVESGARLTFDVAYTAYSGTAADPQTTGTDDKFVVLISTDNMATWTILRQWDNAGSEYVLNDLTPATLHQVFDLADYAGQNTIVAFYAESTESNADNNIHVDNVVFELIPSCEKPTELSVENNMFDATFTWSSDAASFDVAYSTDNTANPVDVIVATVNTTSYEFTNLALGDHYVWVRANCSATEQSEWAGPINIHIGYCVPAPTSVDNNGISNVTFGIGDGIVNNNTTMGSNVATYLDYTSLTGTLQAGVESTVAITYATSYTYGTIIWVDFDNSLSFEESEIIYTGTSASANPTTLEATFVIPATVTPGNYVMRIGGADSNFDGYIAGTSTTAPNPCYTGTYACFQDYTLRVLEAPDCMPVTGLTASNATAHTVDLAWTAGGDETAWVVAYKTADEEEFTEVPAPTNPFTLSGLRAETTYSVKVAADCGDTQSTYTNEISITTDVACPAPTALNVTDATPYGATINWTGDAEGYTLRYRVAGANGFNYGFEDAEPWTITDFSPCTVYDGDGGTTYGFNGWTFTNAYYVGACIAFNNDNEGGGNMVSHSGDAFGVMFSNGADEDDNPVQNNDWFILPELTIAEGDVFSFWGREITTQYGDETINVGIYGTTDGTFAEVLASNVAVNTQEYVKFEYDLSAYAGQTIKLAINYVSTDIFGFMFDDIFVGDPNAGTWDVVDAEATSPYVITGLTPGTTYDVEVQANCGEDGESTWTATSFTTPSLCNSISTLPVDETTLTETSATLSWTGYSDSYNVRYRTAEDADILLFEDFSNGIGDWTTSNLNSSSGPNTSNAYFAFHWTTAPPQYLISPELEGVVDGTVLQFIYAAPSTSWTETFQVGYSSTGTDVDADFTWGEVVETVNNTGEYYTEQVPAGTKYFAIKCTSDDQYYLYVTNFLVYANYVAAGEWQYVNNVTTTSTTLNDLEPGTWYEWQVQGADCGNNWIYGEDFQTLTEGVVQETALIAGWNWFSTYIEVEDAVAMLQAVEASLGENGIMIKNSDGYSENDPDWGWFGDLDEEGIYNEQMYKIQVSGPCTVTVEGIPANPADHSITINPGWNWIGFPCSVTMSVDDAFAGFAKDGDKIRNSDGETPYDADWEMWLGDIETLEPGQGYMYYSSRSEQRTLVFPTGAKTRSVANFGSLTKKQFKITVTDNSKSTDNNLMTKKAFKK